MFSIMLRFLLILSSFIISGKRSFFMRKQSTSQGAQKINVGLSRAQLNLRIHRRTRVCFSVYLVSCATRKALSEKKAMCKTRNPRQYRSIFAEGKYRVLFVCTEEGTNFTAVGTFCQGVFIQPILWPTVIA